MEEILHTGRRFNQTLCSVVWQRRSFLCSLAANELGGMRRREEAHSGGGGAGWPGDGYFVCSSGVESGARPASDCGRIAGYGGSLRSVGDLDMLCEEGQLDEALKVVEVMEQRGIRISSNIAHSLLKICTRTKDLAAVRRVRSVMVRNGLDSIAFLCDHLIRLFASCGRLVEANEVFLKVAKPSVYTWSAIILANARLGEGDKALELYHKMQQSSVKSNKYVYTAILISCTKTADLAHGRLIHGQTIESGLHLDVIIGSALVDMYAKCGSLEEARGVFDKLPNRDVVSWGTMITGYALHGQGLPALELFQKMQQEAVQPNKAIFLSLLKACGGLGAISQGRLIHGQIIESGLTSDVVIGSALIDMYAKCGSLEEAHSVFDKLPNQDVVSWGALIAGYALHGHGLPAIELFHKMQLEGIKPSKVLFLSVLKACGSIAAIEQGRLIHDEIIQSGLESDVLVGTTLVDMYAKCGSLEEARKVFDKLPNRNVVSWAAMIAGYARCGNCRLAVQCLEDMQQEGLKPVDVIFTNILAACCHAGLVDEGRRYFKSMREDHGITPNIEHYNCMVDLLGRAGHLNEAEGLLQTIQSNIIGWRSLLTACRTYGNVELGRRCFDQVVQLDPSHAAGYVLMSNIYANACMWKDAEKIEELRKCAGVWKIPGMAWIEVKNKVHEFMVGDKSHPQSDEIDAKLKMLSRQMKEDGYVSPLDLVLQPISDKDKEDALCGHCEKLAIAFGLVSTPRGTIIRATKNLRVCPDCHNATKIISKLEEREIIIRDAYRIHHFKDGACSCADYF